MPMKPKGMIKLLKKNGFQVVSQNGSHMKISLSVSENGGKNSMKKLYYPAVFHAAEEGGFWVSFPDVPECLTEGDDMDEAYERAVEAIGLALTERLRDGGNLPTASNFLDITEEGTLVVIPLDMDEYNRKYRSRAVKKTLTIPEWLNERALDLNLNFSQVLQEALLEKIIT